MFFSLASYPVTSCLSLSEYATCYILMPNGQRRRLIYMYLMNTGQTNTARSENKTSSRNLMQCFSSLELIDQVNLCLKFFPMSRFLPSSDLFRRTNVNQAGQTMPGCRVFQIQYSSNEACPI